jgi:hypothetical protein
LFAIPVLRYMKTYGLTHEQLAMISVVRREWAAKNPRATFKTPITVEDVLNSRMIAYPFRLSQCCLVTRGDHGKCGCRPLQVYSAPGKTELGAARITSHRAGAQPGHPISGHSLLGAFAPRRRPGIQILDPQIRSSQ